MSASRRRDPRRYSPAIAIKDDGGRFALEGALDIRTLREAANSLNAWQRERKSRTLDLRNLSSLDTPGALLLCDLQQHGVELAGIHALPIVGLMAIMISVVIGYQGVAQLRPYGGEDFTINLVAVSMLREMGVLITAIMVAGRSGSAFTAEIGVMKSREEVDALNVMGMDPMELLVVPRLIGLIITLPLLTFFSDVMGLLGGALISETLLDVSPLQYVERVRQAVSDSDLFVGLFNAPIFGF